MYMKLARPVENAVHHKAGLLLTQLIETLHLKHGRVELTINAQWVSSTTRHRKIIPLDGF